MKAKEIIELINEFDYKKIRLCNLDSLDLYDNIVEYDEDDEKIKPLLEMNIVKIEINEYHSRLTLSLSNKTAAEREIAKLLAEIEGEERQIIQKNARINLLQSKINKLKGGDNK